MSKRAYAYITKHTSPNQNARNAKIKSITIHHWGSRGQNFDNVVSWLCDKRAGTSAHYVVQAGKVACIVDPDRRAWHAGSSRGNHESIGIECRPEATAGDYATVAALVADLRAEYGNLPLVPHKSWTSTACPGVWDLGKIDRLARAGAGSEPAKTPAAGSASPAAPADRPAPAFPLPRRRGAMFYYGPPGGPQASVSGRGLNTKVPADVQKIGGRWRSHGLAKWQQRMVERGYSLTVDGRYGDVTAAAARNLQRLAKLAQDGKIGPDTWAAAWTLPVQ